MNTDSDSEYSNVAILAGLDVITVIVIIVVVSKFEKKITEIESQIHRMHNVK